MLAYIDVICRSGETVRTEDPSQDLHDSIAAALLLADNLGRTFSNPAYGPAASVRVLLDGCVKLEIQVIMGGLVQPAEGEIHMVDLGRGE